MHFLKIPVFLGWVLRILWSEVPKFASFCMWKCLNFMLQVSFLAGILNWNRCVKFRSLLLLERCKICVKKTYIIYVLWAILRYIVDALSNLVRAGEIRSESTLAIIAFHRVWDVRIPSLSQEKR